MLIVYHSLWAASVFEASAPHSLCYRVLPPDWRVTAARIVVLLGRIRGLRPAPVGWIWAEALGGGVHSVEELK